MLVNLIAEEDRKKRLKLLIGQLVSMKKKLVMKALNIIWNS